MTQMEIWETLERATRYVHKHQWVLNKTKNEAGVYIKNKILEYEHIYNVFNRQIINQRQKNRNSIQYKVLDLLAGITDK